MNRRIIRALVALLLLLAANKCFGQNNENKAKASSQLATRSAPDADGSIRAELDIDYVRQGNPMQRLDVFAPAGATKLPVVVWIHGGGWGGGDKSNVTSKGTVFAKNGFVLVPINYRLRPQFNLEDMMQDAAKAVGWVHRNIASYGGAPDRIFVTGHSAGGQMCALLCTDERFLKSEGVSFSIIRGCMPMDSNTHDVPALYAVLEADRQNGKIPDWTKGVRAVFGDDPEFLRRYSATTHVAPDKGLPPFLVFYAAKSGYTIAQAKLLAERLNQSGTLAATHAVPNVSHSQLATNIGRPGDESTRVLFEFIRTQAKNPRPRSGR